MIFSKNKYNLPFPKNVAIEDIVTNNSAHLGAFQGAVDFRVLLRTPVVASLEGLVVDAVDNNSDYGNSQEFADKANYITIEHKNGEFSQYVHLAKDSIKAKVGDKVKTGQVIAITGLSGWMTAPHLHFFVFQKVKRNPGFEGLYIQFIV